MKLTSNHTIVSGLPAWSCIALGVLSACGCHCHVKLLKHQRESVYHSVQTEGTQERPVPPPSFAVNEVSPDASSSSGILVGLRDRLTRHEPSDHWSHEQGLESQYSSTVAAGSEESIDVKGTPLVEQTSLTSKSSRRSVLEVGDSESQPDTAIAPLLAPNAGKTSLKQQVSSSTTSSAANDAHRVASNDSHRVASNLDRSGGQLQSIPNFDLANLTPKSIPLQPSQAPDSEIGLKLNERDISQKSEMPSPVVASSSNQESVDKPQLPTDSSAADRGSNLTKTAPTSLPHAPAKSLQKKITEESTHSTDRLQSQVQVQPPRQHLPPSEQPLELEVKTGAWPNSPEVDPVARAYEIYQSKKSKATFQDLKLIEDKALAASEHPRQTMPGQLASHRKSLTNEPSLNKADSDVDPNLGSTPSGKSHTGLTLLAKPQSASVALPPLVTLRAGAVGRTTPPARNYIHTDSPEIEPRYWPSIPDTLEILPDDESGPIIDLPLSDDGRRLSNRPSADETQQTIER